MSAVLFKLNEATTKLSLMMSYLSSLQRDLYHLYIDQNPFHVLENQKIQSLPFKQFSFKVHKPTAKLYF